MDYEDEYQSRLDNISSIAVDAKHIDITDWRNRIKLLHELDTCIYQVKEILSNQVMEVHPPAGVQS